MDSSNQGFKFGFFDALEPGDQEEFTNSLRSGSARLELYWEKPASRGKSAQSPRSASTSKVNFTTTATQTLDAGLPNNAQSEEPTPRPPVATKSGPKPEVPSKDRIEESKPIVEKSTVNEPIGAALSEKSPIEVLLPTSEGGNDVKPSVDPKPDYSVPVVPSQPIEAGESQPAEVVSDIPLVPEPLRDRSVSPKPDTVKADEMCPESESPTTSITEPPMNRPHTAVSPDIVAKVSGPNIVRPPGLHMADPPVRGPSPNNERPLPMAAHMRSPPEDFSSVQRCAESEPQPVRGHVEDGVYTRPTCCSSNQNYPLSPNSSSSFMNNKPYQRRNKKVRPPDYYKRLEQETGVPGGQQMPAMVNPYHQVAPVVSMQQAPHGYMGMPATAPPASVMSSQYGQHIPVTYSMMSNMMTPLQQAQQVQQQQQVAMQMQHILQHRPQAPNPQYMMPQQQADMMRMMQQGYNLQYLAAAQSPIFNPQVAPNNMAQNPQPRTVAISPSTLPPNMPPQQIGRSPPRGPPMGNQFHDMRPVETHPHMYQHPQASPSMPPTHASHVPIQTTINNHNFNQPSINAIQKDVGRTGGPRMPMNVVMSQQQPHPNITPYSHPQHPAPVVQQQKGAAPINVAGAPPAVAGTPPAPKGDSQHEAEEARNQIAPAGPQASQPDIRPLSSTTSAKVMPNVQEIDTIPDPLSISTAPPAEQEKSAVKDDAPLVNNSEESVNIVKKAVNIKEITPQAKPVDKTVDENKKGKDERTTRKPSFSGGLTFGTVLDIATMNAQSTEKPPTKIKISVAGEKSTDVASRPRVNSLGAKPTPKPPVGSVEEKKPIIPEPAEEFHDALPPPEDLKDKPQVVKPNVVVANSVGSVNNVASPTINCAPPINNAPAFNKVAESSKPEPPAPVVAETPPVPVAEPVKPKVAWASLFKSESKPASVNSTTEVKTNTTNNKITRKGEEKEANKKPVPTDEDSKARKLGEFLSSYVNKFSPVSLQPRGLYNRSNWCYINATMQALLACPAFYQLMKAVPSFKPGARGPTSTPVIDCMSQFVNEFTEISPQNLKYIEKSVGKGPSRSNAEVRYGQPFEPVNVLKMLDVIQSSTSFKLGRQEDAEEFLGVLLNALHEEMVACINATRNGKDDSKSRENGDISGNSSNGPANDNEDDDDQWEQVGPKNKSVVTRSAKISRSPISDTFGGQLRSTVHTPGQKESCTLQPFFSLQLDIQNEKVTSVPEALEALASKETLHGYTNDNKQEVEAYRRYTLDELPPVLILHLKCFVYQKTGGVQKVSKKIDVPMELVIGKDLLSPNAKSKYSQSKRNYELFSVVQHHGMRAVGGHYTADIYHAGITAWVHLDDSQVQLVSQAKVMQYEATRFPYLLYYRRKDLN